VKIHGLLKVRSTGKVKVTVEGWDSSIQYRNNSFIIIHKNLCNQYSEMKFALY